MTGERLTVTGMETLRNLPRPAWLWDPDLRRIVWANPAAVAFFGEDGLLDLVERPFDAREPAVVAMNRAIEADSAAGEHRLELLFPALSSEPLEVRLRPHALADGRRGALIEALSPVMEHGAGLMRDLLDAMPIPVAAVDAGAGLLYANPAALELFGEDRLAGLSGLFADEGAARDFLAGAARAGMATRTMEGRTRLGRRDIRLTARLIGEGKDGHERLFTVLLEDVTARRRIGRALEHSAAWPPPPAPGAPPPRDETAGAPPAEEGPPARLPLSKEDISAFHRLSRQGRPSSPAPAAGPPAGQPRRDKAGERRETAETPPRENERGGARQGARESEHEPRPARITDLVREVLDNRPVPIILHKDAAFVHANRCAREQFGFPAGDEGFQDLTARLATASDGDELRLRDGGGHMRTFVLKRDIFPWRDGVLMQSVLSPVPADSASPDKPESQGEKPPREPQGDRRPPSPDEASETASDKPPHAEPAAGAERTSPQVRIVSKPRASEEVAHASPAHSASTLVKPQTPRAATGMDEELRVILDTATDGIITLNRQGRILSFSAGAQALFGLSVSEAVGKAFTDLMDGESRALVEDYISALAAGTALASVYNEGREVTARVAGGGRIPLFLTIGKMGRKGEPERDNKAAFCVVVRDITQWKETEKDLRQAKERAERSSAQKSEFLASISHELRTPLNAILGFSDVMRQQRFGDMGNEKYLGYANDIHESGEHLLSLINDLLDLSKIEAGKFELDFKAVDLADLVGDCLNLMQEQAARAHVILRRSIPATPLKVVADARAMKQILLNLLSNAVKFTGPGGQVMVSLTPERSGELTLSVADTGPGMTEEEVRRALKPFERITAAGRPEQPGTGLGLPLTRALVEANHARFSISSKPGKGTTVSITFPTPRVLEG